LSRREFTSKTPIPALTGTSNSQIPEKEHKNEGYIRIGGQMYVADVELLVDVGQLPASVFEEELAIENERACEGVEKQSATKMPKALPYSCRRNGRYGIKDFSSPMR
jgi:hypothetical protein